MLYLFLLVAGFLPSRGLHENTPNMRGSLISHHLFSWIWASLSDECISLDTVRLCCFALHLFLGWSTGRQQTESIQKSELKFKISNLGAVLLSLSHPFWVIKSYRFSGIFMPPSSLKFSPKLQALILAPLMKARSCTNRSPGFLFFDGKKRHVSVKLWSHVKILFQYGFKRVFLCDCVLQICLLDKLDTCSSHWLARTQQQQQQQ